MIIYAAARRIGVWGLAGLLAIGLTVSAAHSAETVDRIVAVVNDNIIRLVELNKAMTPF